ncbi:hypothetical protein NCER_101485 [Vairimorpha ceranae BRL01]|uniref:Arf-GAP domain-containing protein n=1 Tax=Vairimorpha ceranae (strain BRL01) TaxID=578460 RepID=C4VA47_VAIC1|nr:hypothetical protein NCER_101485 [Vairimorpha ceranae BRL01]
MNEDTILEKSVVNKFFKNIKQRSLNNICTDCSKCSPIWVSLTYSFFICSDCAARHRQMGVKKSVVKSTLLDKWKVGELRRVWVGGNKNKHKLSDNRDIFVKYKDADFLVEELDVLVEESIDKDKYDFLNIEELKNNIVIGEIKEEPLPKFGDECEQVTKKTESSKKMESRKTENVCIIRKKNIPILSKNKKFVIEDESRLGFITK